MEGFVALELEVEPRERHLNHDRDHTFGLSLS